MIADTVMTHSEQADQSIALSDTTLYFNNIYSPADGELNLSGTKDISGREMTANDIFEFELRESNENFDENGTVLQTVRNNGKTITFNTEKIESEGTKFFIVKEKNAGQRIEGVTYDDTVYQIKVTADDNDNGELVLDTVINKKGDTSSVSSLDFVNVYTADKTSAQFKGYKSYNGVLDAGEKFTFELLDSERNVIDTATAGKNEEFVFDAIEYTSATPNVYTYSVREVNGGDRIDGITYSNIIYQIKVTVTDMLDGTLNAAVEYSDGVTVGPINRMNYTNTYKADDTTVQFKGHKTLEYRPEKLKNGEFTFKLYKRATADHNSALTELDTVSNDINGDFSFKALTYTDKDAGNHYYVVKEVDGGEKIDGVTYDDTVYYIDVNVYDDNDGSMAADITVYTNKQPTTPYTKNVLDFSNTYAVADGEINLTGTKDISGREMTANDIFEFELRESNENFIENGTVLQTVRNSGKTITFNTVKIESEGTKFFIVKEKNAGQRIEGVTYDDTVYQIKVKATDGNDGKYILETSINKKGNSAAVTSLDFVNVYTADKTSAKFSGTKTLKDRPLAIKNNEFTFELYNAVNGAVSGNYIQQVKNSGNSFEFKPIEYTETGVHLHR